MYKNIGIIGAGTMGIGTSIDFAFHGIHSVLVDVSEEQLNRAKAEIAKVVRFAPIVDKDLPRLNPEDVLTSITFTTNIEAVTNCEYIVENVTEDWDIKAEVYMQLNKICLPEVYFAANTSCTSITKIGSLLDHPDRVIGVHLMNPVYLKKSVEVIKGFHTSERCITATKDLLTQLEKDCIIVNDLPGFVSNRVSHLFMNEAVFCVQDNVASPAEIDEIFKKCYGHKMGPLQTIDLIGLDTVVKSLDVLYQSYQDSKFRVCPLLRKMVDAGLLGKKSGQGFYSY